MNCRRMRACERPNNHPGPCGYAGGYVSPRSKKQKLVPFEDQRPDAVIEAERDSVNIQPAVVLVTVAPIDDDEMESFAIRLEWKGGGRWLAARHSRYLAADGSWSNERVYHDQQTADRLARAAAPSVRVNGRTWDEWQAHFAALDAEEATR